MLAADVADQGVGLHPGECLDGLLQGRVDKGAVMEVVEVDVVQAQAAHAHVGRLTQVPLAASGSHVRVFGAAAKEAALGRDDEVVWVGVEGFLDEFLVGMRAVDISGVDEGDAGVDDLAQEVDALVVVGVLAPDLRTGQLHCAVTDPADGELTADGDC